MREVFNEIELLVRERADMSRDMDEEEIQKIIDEAVLENMRQRFLIPYEGWIFCRN